MRFFFGLVGIGMFVGFGALWGSLLLDLRAYPDVPHPITVREAVSMEEPPRGSWVELTDVRFPCSMAEQRPSKSEYRLGFGESDADRIIVSGARECSDTPVKVVGVLGTATPGRIVDLEFPGYPWDRWPRAWQTTLWTSSGPEDAMLGAWFLPPFALLGILVALFFWKPEPPPFTALSKLTEGLSSDEAPAPVLPEGGLRLAREWYAKVITGGFLFAATWLFVGLGIVSLTIGDSWWLRVPMLAFFGGLSAFMIFISVKAVRGWSTEGRLGTMRSWALAPVVAFEDRGFGNGALKWVHPHTGVTNELVFGAHEPPPLSYDGWCLVVWSDPTHLIVVRERFVPFALSPTEQRAAARRFIQHVWRENLAMKEEFRKYSAPGTGLPS